jgi:hypothetical protein
MKTHSPRPSQVPEYYKNGLHAQEQFNHFRASRTQERVHARLQELATSGIPFRPYSDGEFADLKVELQADIAAIFADNRMVRARASAVLCCCCGTLTLDDSPTSALASTATNRLITKSLAGVAKTL